MKNIIFTLIIGIFFFTGCGQAEVKNLPSEKVEKPSIEESQPDITTELSEPNTEADEDEKANTSSPSNNDYVANTSLSWYLRPNLEHTTPGVPADVVEILQRNAGFYVLPSSNKIYLTFDEGYELGYTPQILDTLKAYNVKATFFITGHYLKSQPDLVLRMVNEGHTVANHTVNHPNLATVSTEKLADEILSLDEDFNKLTGTQMGKYIRPPAGNYSEASLKATSEIGYKTVFWSLAFNDWDPNNQPGREFSYNYVVDHIHPGAVILLHAVSASNTEALADIITDLQKSGYVFSLFE